MNSNVPYLPAFAATAGLAASQPRDAFSDNVDDVMAKLRTRGTGTPSGSSEHHSSRMERGDDGRFLGYAQ